MLSISGDCESYLESNGTNVKSNQIKSFICWQEYKNTIQTEVKNVKQDMREQACTNKSPKIATTDVYRVTCMS